MIVGTSAAFGGAFILANTSAGKVSATCHNLASTIQMINMSCIQAIKITF